MLEGSFTKVMARLVINIFLLQLAANASILKGTGTSPEKNTPGEITATTIASTSPFSTKVSSAKQGGSSSTLLQPSPTRSCSIKRGLGKRDCYGQSNAPWHLHRISQNPMISWKNPNNYEDELEEFDFPFIFDPKWGENVLIYMIDGGVDGSHSAFKPDQVQVGEFVSNLKNDPNRDARTDISGHGTGVGSLAVGKINGIARSAKIVPIKASIKLSAAQSDVSEALDIAVQDWNTRSIQNPSLRAVMTITYSMVHRTAMKDALKSALDAGMHVIQAGGNSGVNNCYGHAKDPKSRMVKNIGQIIVSGIRPTLKGNQVVDQYDDNFNHGACIDIFAPGQFLYVPEIGTSKDYVMVEGTSYSTRVVAGVVAALLSPSNSHLKYRDLEPAAFKAKFLAEFSMSGIDKLPVDTQDRMLVIQKLIPVKP